MTAPLPVPRLLPVTLERTAAGDAARLDAGPLSLLQYPATPVGPGPAGVHLRHRRPGDAPWTAAPLTGPAASGAITADGTVTTEHHGLLARARLAATAGGDGWAWTITLHSTGTEAVEVDLLHTLDAALAARDHIRRNEQYVAQYLDLTPVTLPGDTLALAVRQNLPEGEVPWAVIGADAPVAQWGTDALQLLDCATGAGLDPARDLPSERLQHEHTLAALRTAPVVLAPGEEWTTSFWGAVLADHPAATSPEDAALITVVRAQLTLPAPPAAAEGTPLPVSLLARAAELPVEPATTAELEDLVGGPLHLVERHGEEVLAAFGPEGHVVTAAKERAVLRPHGHIQQATAHAEADLATVASTVWMRGVLCSQLTVGHASSGELTGVRRSYLGLERHSGVRLLHRAPGGAWELLGVPSAWSTTATSSRWLYRGAHGTIRVSSQVTLPGSVLVTIDRPDSRTGDAGELLLLVDGTEQLAAGITADGTPVPLADDAALFEDGTAHGSGLRTAALGTAGHVEVRLGTTDDASATEAYAPRLPALTGADGEEAAALGEMLGWLAQNAAVHFRSPRGLEQYSGGAWGTRDVCQGPLGLLLATDEPAALRSTLLSVLGAQQEDGTWPQWFDYLPGHAGPGLRDSHGDVVYWPLRALGEYLDATGDASILGETAPWVGEAAMGAPTSVLDHLTRAVTHIEGARTEDPRLPAYGHGDWNDSLQPARPELARHLCSTWTTELEITALTGLADALAEHAGEESAALVERCRTIAAGAAEAFAELLLVDGELAGYGWLEEGRLRHLVHPTDTTTGLQHGSLQMIHALTDELLTPEQARHHLDLIDEHLAGPTGVYLFDHPVEYHGGVMEVFQRAETATFWGREIGLMYMHSHLRFIEALTHLGEAERAWQELLKAVPIGVTERIRGARPRQANCYYSSSDAVFPDRYVAAENGAALFDESTGFEGGWRVYSSGPGLLLRLVVEDVLGVRGRAGRLEIDPVLPAALDGTTAEVPFDGGMLTVQVTVGETGCGVRSLRIDGQEIDLAGEGVRGLERRYRAAGVAIDRGRVRAGTRLEVVTS